MAIMLNPNTKRHMNMTNVGIKQKNSGLYNTYLIERDDPTKHLLIHSTINSPQCSMSGVHGFKDFLCSDHLLESFAGRIYSYGSVLKSKFVHQRIHEDEHYRDNPSNHELLTVRGVDCRVLLCSLCMTRNLPAPNLKHKYGSNTPFCI